MRKIIFILAGVLLFSFISIQDTNGQSFIKKIKKKTKEVTEKIFEDKNDTNDDDEQGNTSTTTNTRGSGLDKAELNVQESIKDAQTAFNDKKYTDARYNIRQAILGVELEIGEKVLESLPESIAGIPKVADRDNVTSSGIGFVGLIIERVYQGGGQEFRVSVGNDAGLISIVNMYLSSGAYASSSEEQDYKHTKFKEYPAIIEYDDDTGYTLSVPFGQSSLLVTEGVNFSTESEFMDASLIIDLETIKTQLGEE
jgi:hypothetical protein